MTVIPPRLHSSRLCLAHCAALVVLATFPAWAQPPEEAPQNPLFFVWLSFSIFLAVVLALAGSVAFVVVLRGAKSDLVDREAEILEHHRTAAFLWGLPTTAVLLFFWAALHNGGEGGKGLGMLIGGVLLAAATVGGAGLSTKVGRQIMVSWGKPEASPGAAAAIGATALFLLTLIPPVGWAYGIYNLILSVGAFRLAAISRPPRVRRPRIVGSRTASIKEPATPSSPTH